MQFLFMANLMPHQLKNLKLLISLSHPLFLRSTVTQIEEIPIAAIHHHSEISVFV